tara:strand:- start:2 stop:190 length:189 start_codon:yes stop_codon:yes gene_type:complete
MDEINFTSAKYIKNLNNVNSCIVATVQGQEGNLIIPIAEGNRHYDEIKRQVDAGTLTIEAAD